MAEMVGRLPLKLLLVHRNKPYLRGEVSYSLQKLALTSGDIVRYSKIVKEL